ncbi:1,4-dihydroxy-2-naphthoate octaprenyltransferase [Blattabacterium cuenoti]|uniref:1,4-dihydroxy-2-naphthoate octaprenyltransferase n=1 Tax=Blattabacterium cuenoti TaxID=1653831 RepID=UPI00163CB9B9|nr:1,4-dihydroxy-2-naphthoate octaprenyltransferase [Blattabacterium cuenoti]
MKFKKFLYAIRINTLMLSFSGITLSFLISLSKNITNITTYLLSLSTAVSLQILSNLANDYGDSIYGLDNLNRVGPRRAIQSGFFSFSEMRIAIYLFSFLSFLLGFLLIFHSISMKKNFFLFLLYIIGLLLCIFFSIKYSLGNKPYGYIVGIGDLLVFIFFGLFSIEGSFFLYTRFFSLEMFFLSLSIGLLNSSVLNINNMRDMENDFKNGKNTLAGFLGKKYAKFYHFISVITSLFFGVFFIFLTYKNFIQWFFYIINIPFFIDHLKTIYYSSRPKEFTLELNKLIFLIFFYSMSIGISSFTY